MKSFFDFIGDDGLTWLQFVCFLCLTLDWQTREPEGTVDIEQQVARALTSPVL